MLLEKEIKKQRMRLGWTQVRLGNMVGVRQATISRIESNARNSSWGLIQKILIALEVELKDLNTITHGYVLKESDLDLFLKLLMAKPELRVHLLYNPVHCAGVIIAAFKKGILDFSIRKPV